MSFRLKLVLGVAAVQALLLLVLVATGLEELRRSSEEELEIRARTTAVLLASLAEQSVLATDLATLEAMLEAVMDDPEMAWARVVDEQGRVLAEVGNPVASTRPLAGARERSGDQSVVALARIDVEGIERGRVELAISAANLRSLLAGARMRLGAIALVTVALVALFSLALAAFVRRQLGDLAGAAHALAGGDLAHRVPVRGRDELARAAEAFNRMSAALETAHADLKRSAEALREANQGLEGEVEQRTAELRDAKERAESASRAKSEFLSSISHELRTPLNAVIGYAEMLAEEADARHQPALLADLQRIRAAARHLLALINDVLDLSKVEAGRMDLHPQCFAVCELVDEVTATVAPLVARNGNRLEVHCAGDAGAMDSDPLKLRQVLYNLLSNAAKFTQQGVIELRVCRLAATGGDRLHFRVADTGAGMDPAQVARLFEPFFQGQAFLTRRVGGTGLGLAISRRFAELMGGDIQVASKPGEGSVFTVCLPADLPREGTTRLASHG